MAIYIYKYTEYVPRDAQGVGTTRRGGGNAPCDLSKYYTIEQMLGHGTAPIHYSNIIYDGRFSGFAVGVAEVTGHLIALETGLWGTSAGVTTVSGTMTSSKLVAQTDGQAEVYGVLHPIYSSAPTYTFDMSIEEDSAGVVTLVNDEDDPGIDKYYGTNGAGTKGWYDLPDGGGVDPSGTPVDNQVAVWVDENTIEGTTGLTFNSATATLTVNNVYSNAGSQLNLQPGSLGSGNVNIGTMGGSNYVYLNAYSTNVGGVLQVTGNYFFYGASNSLNGAWGTVGNPDGYNITLKGGDAYAVGDNNGGNVYIYGGQYNGAGSFGRIYFGTGAAGRVHAKTSETDVIYYDPSTGKISYGAIATGDVSVSGTPVDDQVAIWTGASTIEGQSGLTFSASTLNVTNAISTGAVTASTSVTTNTLYGTGGTLNLIPHNSYPTIYLGGAGYTPSTVSLYCSGTQTDIALYIAPKNAGALHLGNQSGSGGAIYFGDGGGGGLSVKTSETAVVYYNPTTGLLSYDVAASGDVNVSGSPADNQIAVWTDAHTIEGTTNLYYSGGQFTVTGTIYSSGDMTATNFCLSSDESLKENILHYNPRYLDVDYKTFEMKANPGQVRYGVIAQELAKNYPEFVRVDCECGDKLSVAYMDLLICEVAYLKEKVKQLESLLNGSNR